MVRVIITSSIKNIIENYHKLHQENDFVGFSETLYMVWT